MNKILTLAALCCGIFSDRSGAAAAAAAAAAERCAALQRVDFKSVEDAPTQISHARLVAAVDDRPAFCLVEGSVTPYLDIEVRLPDAGWNGKFLTLANVASGEVCNAHLRRGYACMPLYRSFSKGRSDREWTQMLLNDLQARGITHKAPHLLTVAAKAITSRFYARPPAQAYFMGCSGGGYAAMLEAQRFSWDYDGIVAGAPNLDTADWLMRALWNARNSMGPDNEPILNPVDLQTLHAGVLAACDRDDGVTDGIVSHPAGCHFDPASLLCTATQTTGCLTRAQVTAVERIYAGPMMAVPEMARSAPDMLPGSELNWSTRNVQGLYRLAQAHFEYTFDGTDPALTLQNFDFEHDYKRAGISAAAKVDDPDLRQFKRAGGKLIAYLGTYDTAYVTGVIDYYETVERTMGGRAPTQDFFRLFLVPGMGHCSGGPGASAIEYLSYLEAWVERGRAPDVMIGAHLDEVKNPELSLDPSAPVAFTRPLYPYPLFARYRGSGDPDDAANFAPVDPQAGSPNGQ